MSVEPTSLEPAALEIDFGQRELCLDGACVGVIGADGRCSGCGLDGIAVPASAADREAMVASLGAQLAALPGVEPGDDLDLASRQLCPDGACIGVVGDDGRCRVCDRPGPASA